MSSPERVTTGTRRTLRRVRTVYALCWSVIVIGIVVYVVVGASHQ